MKKLIILLTIILMNSICSLAQKPEVYDIVTFIPPKGWEKESKENALVLGRNDGNGGMAIIAIYKSSPSLKDCKINFDLSWARLVNKMVTISSELQRSPSSIENGWATESGIVQYSGSKTELNLGKGMAMQFTSCGVGKMVNIVVINNSHAFNEEIFNFIDTITLPAIKNKKNSMNQPNNNPSKSTKTKKPK